MNLDNNLNPSDVVLHVNHIYKSEIVVPHEAFADCNCDGATNPVDVVILVNHVYKGDVEPCP